MVFNRNFNRSNLPQKFVGCSCGGEAKLFSRKNYPFGRNSKSVKSRFYKCKSCDKVTFLEKERKGKNRGNFRR